MLPIEIRRALRSLRRTPSFTIPLIATVALATALVTATFAVVYGILFRPLPFPHGEQLVLVGPHYGTTGAKPNSVSPPDFGDRMHARSFASAAVWRQGTAVLGGTDPARITTAIVSGAFFQTLGVRPLLGAVTSDDDAIILSYGTWQRRFGGKRDVIGRTIVLDNARKTIAAVMPPEFDYPSADTEMWQPMTLRPDLFADDQRPNEYLSMFARLAPGVSVAEAQAEADVISRNVVGRIPDRKQFLIESHWRILVRGMRDVMVEDARPALTLLLVAAMLVFVIGAANTAALVLTRSASRWLETSLRSALGAGLGRAVAPRLTEAWISIGAGGAIGVGFAVALTRLVVRGGASFIPRAETIRVDAPVLAFSVLLVIALAAVVSTVAFLRPRHAGSAPGRFASAAVARLRSALVVFEVALATALLIAGALVVESLRRLSSGDPGFHPQNVLTFRVSAPESMRKEPRQMIAFLDSIQQRLQRVPGVDAVSATSYLPFSDRDMSATFNVEGRSNAPGVPTAGGKYRRILPGFDKALGLPLLRGRMFDARDNSTSPRVCIIDETAAKLYWPNVNPVGRRLTYSDLTDKEIRWREIVGIVGAVRHGSLAEEPVPHVYIPFLQSPESTMTFIIRSALPADRLAAEARAAVRATAPGVPVDQIRMLDEYVASSLAQPKLGSTVVSTFALVALILTAVGIYGLLAYIVTERRRELAVRMALGANTSTMLRFVLAAGMRLAGAGVLLGACGALGARSVLRSILYSVTATDPAAYAGVAVSLLAVAAVASYVPARRASRVDPAHTLRAE